MVPATDGKRATQTVIITGANSGVGYECAKAIAAAGDDWQVVIASRDNDKSEDAARKIASETSNPHIAALKLDLGSLADVRRFASEILARGYPPLRALVCNAGLQIVSGTTFSAEGFEATFAVNHLGHFLLANLMLRQLEPPARIIFVSSGTHDPDQFTGGMPKPKLMDARSLAQARDAGDEKVGTVGRRRYTTSKLCNVLCTYELSRRLRADGHHNITVNAYDPGLVPGTGLIREYSTAARLAYSILGPLLTLLPSAHTARTSGRALARLVLASELEGVTEKYFACWKETPSSKESYDKNKAAELWTSSMDLVRLAPDETILRLSL